jgi:hypothetical protein
MLYLATARPTTRLAGGVSFAKVTSFPSSVQFERSQSLLQTLLPECQLFFSQTRRSIKRQVSLLIDIWKSGWTFSLPFCS